MRRVAKKPRYVEPSCRLDCGDLVQSAAFQFGLKEGVDLGVRSGHRDVDPRCLGDLVLIESYRVLKRGEECFEITDYMIGYGILNRRSAGRPDARPCCPSFHL